MRGTEDILGHRAVVDRLWRAMTRGALHHAYLFEGPPGVGKHLVALRLAMAANCEAGPPLPCGACGSCRRIAAGSHPDVITLAPDPEKATPIIPVDAVREVVRKASYHRYDSRRRFILVDPADALQDAAANALLKTLEEPPDGTGFVLVATNASALLPTIVSRCQRVRFSAVPEPEIAAWLTARGVDQPELAARLALGCPGQALSLAEGRLEARTALRAQVLDVLRGPIDGVIAFADALCKGRRQDWSPKVLDLLALIEDLLRDVVVHASGADSPLLNPDAAEVVAAWSRLLWPGGVTACAHAVRDARASLALNVSGRTLVEALLSRIGRELHAPSGG